MPQTTRARTTRTTADGRPHGFTARQWARCQRNELSDEEFAACLYRTVTEGPAPLTDAQACQIAAQYAEDAVGVRLALATLAADGSTLKDYRLRPRDVAEGAAELIAWADATVPRLRALANLLHESCWRLRVALADRDDFNELLSEAAERHPAKDYGEGGGPAPAGATAVEGLAAGKVSDTAVRTSRGGRSVGKDPRDARGVRRPAARGRGRI